MKAKAPPKQPVIYKNVIEDAPEEIPEDGPNFSPLRPPRADYSGQAPLPDELRDVQMLIDDLYFEQPEAENHGSDFPIIFLGIAISGTGVASGVVGWLLARRRR